MTAILKYASTGGVLLVCLLMLGADVSTQPHTNAVRVLDDLFYAITDEVDGHGTNYFGDLQIQITNGLYYVLQHRATNLGRLAYSRRNENPVVLELIDSTGKQVPRTQRGIANASAPPKKLEYVEGGARARAGFERLPRRGETYIKLVGPLTSFFRVSEPGAYTLEARFRYWCYTNNEFGWFLSEPVRLPVIVRDPVKQVDPSLKKSE